MGIQLMRTMLIAVTLIMAAMLHADGQTAVFDCPSGASVPDEAMCGFFREFIARGSRPVDRRILDRFPTPLESGPPIRSFAFVVSVSKYPSLADSRNRDLAAVRKDLPNILSFLKEQKFDEIIVLEDEQATNERIRTVFERYLIPQMTIYGGRARFLFAFDGHGTRNVDGSLPGGLALSTALGENDMDPDHTFPLADLAYRLQYVASLAYQSIALLGSCYSGSIFPSNNTALQSTSYSLKPGAHVVASSKPNEYAWTLGGDNGTVFFDFFLSAVRNARPGFYDRQTVVSVASSADAPNSAIVRLERAVLDVNERLESTNNPRTNQPFPQLKIGAMAPNKDFEGAFFFLGQQLPLIAPTSGQLNIDFGQSTFKDLSASDIALNIDRIDLGTGSSIKLRPDVAVFKVPETYKIRGVDVSHFGPDIDYKLLRTNDIQFVYARATQGAKSVDTKFLSHWTKAREVGLKVGAYHVFSFCQPVQAQFANITKNVPVTADALPLAIDIEWSSGPTLPNERGCGDVATVKNAVFDLSKQISEYYHKVPLIYVSTSAARELVDERLDAFPIWLADYKKSSAAARSCGSSQITR
jgi:hypothetical protein